MHIIEHFAAVKMNKLQLKSSTWIISRLKLKKQVNIKHDSICMTLNNRKYDSALNCVRTDTLAVKKKETMNKKEGLLHKIKNSGYH